MKAWGLLGIALASPAWAEVSPIPSPDDARVQTVRYLPDEPVRLQTYPGDDMTVILAPDEHIETVNISNRAIHQVSLSEARDSFVLHTSMVLYKSAPAGEGTISISSDRRNYELLLSSAGEVRPPYVLRFTYDGSEREGKADSTKQYKLTGNRELRPASIRDDGSKTYIQWNHDQAIPAVFALDRIGREEMVDGYMRDGVFTIDRIHERLVFRIDDVRAEAARPSRSARK